MITIKNLTKVFCKKRKEIRVVDNVTLKIRKGEIFGLIGPNGAGKTTLLKILSTLVLADSGEVIIDGHSVVDNAEATKEKMGVVAGEYARALYWRLTGYQNLGFFARLKGVSNIDKKIEELLELFGLKEWANELVMRYSTGMKHKLAFAIALLSDPPILLLDEPLTGIDPMTARELKDFVKTRLKHKTIVWASHNLYEVEEMCDRIALMNQGKIVLEGSPAKLRKRYWGYRKVVLTSDNPAVFSGMGEVKGKTVEIETKNPAKTLEKIIRITRERRVKVKNLRTAEPTLEEIFMARIKRC